MIIDCINIKKKEQLQTKKKYLILHPQVQPLAMVVNVVLSYFQLEIMEHLVQYVQDEFVEKKSFPSFQAGDTITVYYEIREGEKVRTQFFKGVVIQIKGTGSTKTFTIRKISGTVGVERIFPFNLPTIQKIEVNNRGKVRRSRIFYFRELRGKKARIKEKKN